MSTHRVATGLNRRQILADMGLGFGGLALTAMLHRDRLYAEESPLPLLAEFEHPVARAKSVIWLFMIGGASHLESFDPKPALNQYAGKTIDETPYADVLTSPYLANERAVAFDPNNGFVRTELFPMQVGFKRHGESGLEISDWWPNLARQADDLNIIRSMWTEDSNHGAQLQFHTGRHRIDGFFPSIGSWVHYGLGALNENLPQFVVLGTPVADCCGGKEVHRANYLGPQHDGVPLKIDPKDPLAFARPPGEVFREQQQEEFRLLRELNQLTATEFPNDDAIAARIKAYELAFRMQTAVPGIVDFSNETAKTLDDYGVTQKDTETFGRQMLACRRLVEQGVRFVQVYHGYNGGAGLWDAHAGLKTSHPKLCRQVDQPVAALIADLKQRGLLDETLIVWATEFGRTPGSQKSDGRDHHPYGFSVWLAGGGLRGGMAHGATDEIGFHAVEDRHYVTDIHATILHQLGINPRSLQIPGRKKTRARLRNPNSPDYGVKALMSRSLLLIPTEFEASMVKKELRSVMDAQGAHLEICGFGPIAAGIRTAQLLSKLQPSDCILIGIAGTYSDRLPVGSAHRFNRLACYGIGVGSGSSFISSAELGWRQWADPESELTSHDQLQLKHSTAASRDLQLLTVCAGSAGEKDVEQRLKLFPDAAAEDMEGFAVALACLSANVPLTIVRGISNRAGVRDPSKWDVQSALKSATELAQSFLPTSEDTVEDA